MEKLYLYSKKIEGKPYKTNFIELIKTLTNSNTSENFSSIFCSELISSSYKIIELFPKEVCSNNFLPKDFVEDEKNSSYNNKIKNNFKEKIQ
jgi:uncharacterized protein YycO